MMAEKANESLRHTLTVGARTHAEIAGVTDVQSFDEETVILSTDCGELTLEGEGLHIGTLDIARGVVVVDGRINALYYAEAAPVKRGLRGRLFG